MAGPKLPLCPSYRCEEGAYLLGIVKADGTVAFTPDELRVDADFVQRARQGRTPEARFRFGGPCHQNACQRWTGERCGVIDSVLEEIAREEVELLAEPPSCAIRPQCRWFAQVGERGCIACPIVVTEISGPGPGETNDPTGTVATERRREP